MIENKFNLDKENKLSNYYSLDLIVRFVFTFITRLLFRSMKIHLLYCFEFMFVVVGGGVFLCLYLYLALLVYIYIYIIILF